MNLSLSFTKEFDFYQTLVSRLQDVVQRSGLLTSCDGLAYSDATPQAPKGAANCTRTGKAMSIDCPSESAGTSKEQQIKGLHERYEMVVENERYVQELATKIKTKHIST